DPAVGRVGVLVVVDVGRSPKQLLAALPERVRRAVALLAATRSDEVRYGARNDAPVGVHDAQELARVLPDVVAGLLQHLPGGLRPHGRAREARADPERRAHGPLRGVPPGGGIDPREAGQRFQEIALTARHGLLGGDSLDLCVRAVAHGSPGSVTPRT